MCALPRGIFPDTPLSEAESQGVSEDPQEVLLPQAWPQDEGRLFSLVGSSRVCSQTCLMLSIYMGAARVLNSPLAG